MKDMYEEINVEKEAMNDLLRAKLLEQKEIGEREDEVVKELDRSGVDTAYLDMVVMWMINPGLSDVEESPANKVVPMAVWSGALSIDSDSMGSPVRRAHKETIPVR